MDGTRTVSSTAGRGRLLALAAALVLALVSGCGVTVRSDDREYSVDCELEQAAFQQMQNSVIQQRPDD